MKKTILVASALSLFLVTNIASATSLTELVPANTQGYFQFNTTSQNPIKDWVLAEMPKEFANSISSSTEEQKNAVIKAFKEILTNNNISMGIDYPEDLAVGLKITDTQFKNFLDALGEKATVESENPKIYVTRKDFFFAKSGDLFIAAPTKEKLISILSGTGDHLNTNAEFKDIISEFNSDDTFTVYLSNSLLKTAFAKNPTTSSIATSITDSFKAFGLTLKKTNTGLDTKFIISFDPQKAKDLGINTTANNFTPVLYKYMPSANPMIYVEFSNLKNTITTIINLLGQTGNKTLSGFKIPAEVDPYLSLLEKEIAIYVEKDDQILPAITLVINTSANKKLASDIVTQLTSAIDEALKSKNIEYQKATDKNLTTFTFDLNKLDPTSQLPTELSSISITFGMTPENYLLFSTYSKIASKYGEGLTKNSDFKNAFSNLNQTVAGISYVNIDNISSWYDNLLELAGQTTTNEFSKKQIANNRDLLKKVVKPWHDFSIIKKTTETHSSTELNINFDLNALDPNYFTSIKELVNSTKKTFKSIENARQTFNDTASDQWYYQDVRDLNARGVIKGYEDQSFKPNNNITRAEFLTMILRGFEGDNFDANVGESTSKFKDVSSNQWYANAITKGTNEGIIKGYNDDTFRPDSPINRAEAIAMLSRVIKLKYGENLPLANREFTNQFSDVKEGDWSYEEVKKLYSYSIVDGDSNGNTFSPSRNLNRAEASKIINKALNQIDSLTNK